MQTKPKFRSLIAGAVLVGLTLTNAHAIGLDNMDGNAVTEGTVDFTEVQKVVESEQISINESMRRQIKEIEGALIKLFQGDYPGAMAEFKVAAANGNPAAQNSIGILYEKGLGTPQNHKEAVSWYRTAIAHGSHDALYNLAVLLVDAPEGVTQNIPEALMLFDEACKQGDQGACQYGAGLREEGA